MGGGGALAQRVGQPAFRRLGIGQGFLGGEGLGRDDEQRRRRIEAGQHVLDIRRVHVGDEKGGQVAGGAQGAADHARAQIGSADADIDDIGEALARRAPALAGPDLTGQCRHARERIRDGAADRRTLGLETILGLGTQRHVQGGAAFGFVDGFSGEQGAAAVFHLAFAGKGQQQVQGLHRHAVFGQVQVEAVVGKSKGPGPLGVGQQIAQMAAARRPMMRGERLPNGRAFGRRHGAVVSSRKASDRQGFRTQARVSPCSRRRQRRPQGLAVTPSGWPTTTKVRRSACKSFRATRRMSSGPTASM